MYDFIVQVRYRDGESVDIFSRYVEDAPNAKLAQLYALHLEYREKVNPHALLDFMHDICWTNSGGNLQYFDSYSEVYLTIDRHKEIQRYHRSVFREYMDLYSFNKADLSEGGARQLITTALSSRVSPM